MEFKDGMKVKVKNLKDWVGVIATIRKLSNDYWYVTPTFLPDAERSRLYVNKEYCFCSPESAHLYFELLEEVQPVEPNCPHCQRRLAPEHIQNGIARCWFCQATNIRI